MPSSATCLRRPPRQTAKPPPSKRPRKITAPLSARGANVPRLQPHDILAGDLLFTLLRFSSFRHYDEGTYTSKGLTPEQAAELENRRGPMRTQHPHRAFRSQDECRPWDSLNPQPALAGASRPRCSPSSQLSRHSSCWSASTASWHISLATRARDVGIRMALGAERSDVMLLVQKKAALLRWVSSPGSSPRGSPRAPFRRFSLESGARSNHNLVCLRFARRLRFARGPDSCSAVRLHRSHAGTSDGVGKTLLGATGIPYRDWAWIMPNSQFTHREMMMEASCRKSAFWTLALQFSVRGIRAMRSVAPQTILRSFGSSPAFWNEPISRLGPKLAHKPAHTVQSRSAFYAG